MKAIPAVMMVAVTAPTIFSLPTLFLASCTAVHGFSYAPLLALHENNRSPRFTVEFDSSSRRYRGYSDNLFLSASPLPDHPDDKDEEEQLKKKNASSDGQALASQFYQQVRQNEQRAQKRNEADDKPEVHDSLPSQNQKKRFSGLPSSSAESDLLRQERQGQPQPPTPIKFTGAGLSGSGRPSLFSPEPSNASPAIQREREREFNLVGNFERTLGIQAAILAASLAFVLYVGFTGGITDGSDRDFGGYDEIDSGVINQVYFMEDWSNSNNAAAAAAAAAAVDPPAQQEQPNSQQQQPNDGRSIWL